MGVEYDIILVVVNKCTKWRYFIIYTEEIIVEELAGVYTKEVFIRYGVLEKIILDRDLKFVLDFQETFIAEQEIYIAILIAYYLQIDGQIERLN